MQLGNGAIHFTGQLFKLTALQLGAPAFILIFGCGFVIGIDVFHLLLRCGVCRRVSGIGWRDALVGINGVGRICGGIILALWLRRRLRRILSVIGRGISNVGRRGRSDRLTRVAAIVAAPAALISLTSSDGRIDRNIGRFADVVVKQAVLLQLVHRRVKDKIGLGEIIGLVEVIVPFLVVEIFGGVGNVKQCPDGKQCH